MKQKNTPMRMCVGCRQMCPKTDLVRVVRTPEGTVTTDDRGKMNGRGAYLCKKAECLKKALKTGALSRALNTPIPEEITTGLQEAFQDLEK